ncbi:hypothetical protein BH10PSE9_BH10PSE9_11460 [soil metagenome]
MKILGALCAALAITAAERVAAAPQLQLGIQSALTVPLGCQIRSEKVIVITNTTGAAIANTNISYDAVRKPDGKHYGATKKVTFLAVGGILQTGGVQSFSCTAWFKRVPLLMR